MTERRFSIRYSDGRYGPLMSRESADLWLGDIADDRRHLCRVTCWEEVTDGEAATLRPEPFQHPHCSHCDGPAMSFAGCMYSECPVQLALQQRNRERRSELPTLTEHRLPHDPQFAECRKCRAAFPGSGGVCPVCEGKERRT